MKLPAGLKITTFDCGDSNYVSILHHKDAELTNACIRDGWSFSKRKGSYCFERPFKKHSHFFGYVYFVWENSTNRFETHSYLKKTHRGKGYGSKLYSHAIGVALRRGKRIGSSWYPSDGACRVWEGNYITKRFKIRKYGLTYLVQGRK